MTKAKTALPANTLDYLKQVSLFNGLNDKQLKRMIKAMTVVNFEQDGWVMREGDSGNEIYILLEGEVEISKSRVVPQLVQTAQKQEKALIRLSQNLHPFFGEMSMFGDKATREASIKATKDCRMACLTKEDLLAEIEKDPAIGTIIDHNIASELVKRLRKANKDILKLTTAFSLALEG